MYPIRITTTLTSLAAPLVLAGTLAVSTPAHAQSDCSAAMADFQSALQVGTAEALTSYLGQHAPCFEVPARARLDALGGMPVDAATPATQEANVERSATDLAIEGSYTEPTGGEVIIRLDDTKTLRFVLLNGSTPGDWPLDVGQETPPGEPTVDFIVFADGIFKGARYDIVYGDHEMVELVQVGGNTIWTRVPLQ